MKLTYEDKVQIYELRKQGRSFKELSNIFGINIPNLRYMIKLIDRYGIEFVKKGKNRYYSPKLKREIIDKVLLEGRSQIRVSLVYALPNQGMLHNGMMESFFGILKSEMCYGYENTFQSLEHLEQAIVDYIDYYNNKRIKVKLKGLSPVQYRTKSFA